MGESKSVRLSFHQQTGTVGKPIPGVTAKIIGHESGKELGIGESGLLLIKGPNVMQGYLNQPDLTAEVMRDGSVDMETCLTMLKYAKVLDFVMTTLASRRDIKPQTLRVIFKLAGLKVDEAYPG